MLLTYLQPFTKIMRHFYLLTWLPFTAGEKELDYFHQKLNIRVALQDAKRLKIADLRK